jgi:hypothetical protein
MYFSYLYVAFKVADVYYRHLRAVKHINKQFVLVVLFCHIESYGVQNFVEEEGKKSAIFALY